MRLANYVHHTVRFEYLLIVFFILHLNCASKGRPGGGPVDKIPPEIISTFPQADTTNIQNLNRIEINFSERMDENAVEQSLFISPPINYEAEWSAGSELTLNIIDTLNENRTYVVTIGSGATDSRRNRMKESYQFAFSTSDQLDKGKIMGRIFGIMPKDIFYVYAYQISDDDSISPVNTAADFLTQAGREGLFELNYLRQGDYRVFVIEDQNKNYLLDANYERVGIPSKDVKADTINRLEDRLYYKITRIDTTAPSITSTRAINNKTVVLRISEPIINLRPEMLGINDTLSNKELKIIAIAKSKDDEKQYFVYTEKHSSSVGYQLRVYGLKDTTGNLQPSEQNAYFSGSSQIDTTKFQLNQVSPTDSSLNVRLNNTINFKFTLPVDTSDFSNHFSFWEQSDSLIKGEWSWEGLTDAIFNPISGFRPNNQYTFQLRTNGIQSLWGDTLYDTTITHTYFTISEDEFGSLSGEFSASAELSSDVYVEMIPLTRSADLKRRKIDEERKFSFIWVPAGRYKLGGFIDFDNNRAYSPGKLFPFEYSEPFFINEDTLRIRKRWEITDYVFKIPGN